MASSTPRQFIGYTQEQLNAQAERLGQIFGIEDAARKLSPDVRIEYMDGSAAIITVSMQKIVSVEEAVAYIRAVPLSTDGQTGDQS
ncbi:hypothetical protein [Microbacterium maritypicum]